MDELTDDSLEALEVTALEDSLEATELEDSLEATALDDSLEFTALDDSLEATELADSLEAEELVDDACSLAEDDVTCSTSTVSYDAGITRLDGPEAASYVKLRTSWLVCMISGCANHMEP